MFTNLKPIRNMKKRVKIALIAASAVWVSAAAATDCAAQDNGGIKVKVTGIRNDNGKIMVSGGDFDKPAEMAYGMTEARKDTVVCALFGKLAPGAKIYAFHDENGNFDLDRYPGGKPAEGCFAGTAEPAEDGVITIALTYYGPEETEN